MATVTKIRLLDDSILELPADTKIPVCAECLTILLMALTTKDSQAISEILLEDGRHHEALLHLRMDYSEVIQTMAEEASAHSPTKH